MVLFFQNWIFGGTYMKSYSATQPNDLDGENQIHPYLN